jgi:hypothetical protein
VWLKALVFQTIIPWTFPILNSPTNIKDKDCPIELPVSADGSERQQVSDKIAP